jgi:hypothetical protein
MNIESFEHSEILYTLSNTIFNDIIPIINQKYYKNLYVKLVLTSVLCNKCYYL